MAKLAEKNKGLADAIESFKSGNPTKLKESLIEAKRANAEFPKPDVMLARMFMANRQFGEAMSVLEGH